MQPHFRGKKLLKLEQADKNQIFRVRPGGWTLRAMFGLNEGRGRGRGVRS